MVTLRLFAQAREVVGETEITLEAPTLEELLSNCGETYGPDFVEICANSTIWLNGEQTDSDSKLTQNDEVAILPPVSGG